MAWYILITVTETTTLIIVMGRLPVFDFDNSCFCWYMYDLASLWGHGVGWIQFEKDVNKRMKFMEDYFETVLDGYRSETDLDDVMLEQLPLFLQTASS